MGPSHLAKSRFLPETISIEDPYLLATLWEEQELSDWLKPLTIIAEHINLHDADLTIVAWGKLLSLFEDIGTRYALNMANASTNAMRLGIELPGKDEGTEALSAMLEQIDVTDTTGFPGTRVHPARHLVCSIGVIRACTVLKAAYSLMRSTHAIEPTSGLQELVSRLDRHRQTLSSEVFEYQKRMLVELSEQARDIEAIELQIELRDFRQLGMAHWRAGP